MYSMKIFCWLKNERPKWDIIGISNDYQKSYRKYMSMHNLQKQKKGPSNLFFWYSCNESISFAKGNARAAGIIWQRISWTGACSETARFRPGRSLWSLLMAWTIPTYGRLTCNLWLRNSTQTQPRMKKANAQKLSNEISLLRIPLIQLFFLVITETVIQSWHELLLLRPNSYLAVPPFPDHKIKKIK